MSRSLIGVLSQQHPQGSGCRKQNTHRSYNTPITDTSLVLVSSLFALSNAVINDHFTNVNFNVFLAASMAPRAALH